ncbi:Os12g0113600 [Oryza sativa Japonica Group]|uniref:Os12g0113600 protein n=2 Tax=Oryza sativa subsp. japonica TaxID=39947 RepID=Q0IQL8_ORYSJ|nr:hypothetical protein EE612_057387 [Oryza sativa]BAF28997.1 Os12g0113600 [Oryza sativa Japonica Group]BAT15584.1 Os12g0113600 [Oryza sativa Japonica Group]|eukprot:NP_001065978.1 Os12g0113600 [Oryza sativa Japonica Group]
MLHSISDDSSRRRRWCAWSGSQIFGSGGGAPACRRRRSTQQRRSTHTAYRMLPARAPVNKENPNACQMGSSFKNSIAQLYLDSIVYFLFFQFHLNCVLRRPCIYA